MRYKQGTCNFKCCLYENSPIAGMSSKMSTLCSDQAPLLRWVATFAAHVQKCGFTSCTLLKAFSVYRVCEVGLESSHRLQNVGLGKLKKCSHTEIPSPTVTRSYSALTELCLKLAAVFSLASSPRSFTGLPRPLTSLSLSQTGACKLHFPLKPHRRFGFVMQMR